ncbi:MAG: GAF domain-containing protein [Actinomycetota bacterium]|nr:GAF domain-containing protein [Actinomycetota bacterium]
MPYHALDDPDQLKALLDAFLAIESEVELSGVLRLVVDAARTMTGARYGALGVLDEEGRRLVQFIHAGFPPGAEAAIGRLPRGDGILGLLVVDPRPLRLDDLRTHPDAVGVPPGHPELRSFLGVPVRVRDAVFGNLYLAEKAGGASFSEDDEALVVALATAAGIAVDHARLQARVAELSLAADRERIARDLHDTVIQRLFATGLSLQSSLSLVHEPAVRVRIEEAVGDLDATIRDVRATIFALEQPKGGGPTLRSRVLTVCAEVSHGMGFEPDVRFRGAIDERVPEAVAVELLSSLREALSNVARHAGAGWVGVEIAVDAGLSLVVADDGAGLPPSNRSHGHGIANMRSRARALGGRCSVRARPTGGTEVRWSVPLDGSAAAVL